MSVSLAPQRHGFGTWLAQVVRLATLVLVLATASAGSAVAQTPEAEPVKLQVLDEGGYARLIFDFNQRLDLPNYKVKADNGVLTISFGEPVSIRVPDIPGILPDYITVTRLDPDYTALRLGLTKPFRIGTLEAGEMLFVDIMPEDWAGLQPGLPAEIVKELARRAKEAALDAERNRKAALVASGDPMVKFSVGRNPTFIRLQFDWNMATKADFSFDPPRGTLTFDLPLKIDLFPLISNMPPEIVSAKNEVTEDGSSLALTFIDGVVPRFYENSKTQFVIDVDLLNAPSTSVDIASLLPEGQKPSESPLPDEETDAPPDMSAGDQPLVQQVDVTPIISSVGNTVRMAFPFENRTAAAVFRRGNIIWLFFDTSASVNPPPDMSELKDIADSFDVVPAQGTQIIRLNLSSERLATLASEGQSWVLSLGDILLSSGQPVKFEREQDPSGAFSMQANLINPAAVHQLRDPEVGDILDVVTAYPPSRALVRSLDFVDFSALKTVHGLVIKPKHDDVDVAIEGESVVISAPKGLIVSAPQKAATEVDEGGKQERAGFVDLNPYVEKDPRRFNARLEEMQQRASEAERRFLDSARLDLARYYLANELSFEALGMVTFLDEQLVNTQLTPEVRMVRAAANAMAGRGKAALVDLEDKDLANEVDALMWRTIARVETNDYKGARADALASEDIVSSYPSWVQSAFLMAGIRAGLETHDAELATRLLGKIDTATLDHADLTRYELFNGRLDEEQGRNDEALDTYGQVIAADVRPTRAEAIYQTMELLNKMDRLDPVRAAETLASETMVWRGDDLEAKMMTLLAELYFRNHDYRNAFETVHSVALAHPDSPDVEGLLDEARQNFASLYLNGQADAMQPVEGAVAVL